MTQVPYTSWGSSKGRGPQAIELIRVARGLRDWIGTSPLLAWGAWESTRGGEGRCILCRHAHSLLKLSAKLFTGLLYFAHPILWSCECKSCKFIVNIWNDWTFNSGNNTLIPTGVCDLTFSDGGWYAGVPM